MQFHYMNPEIKSGYNVVFTIQKRLYSFLNTDLDLKFG